MISGIQWPFAFLAGIVDGICIIFAIFIALTYKIKNVKPEIRQNRIKISIRLVVITIILDIISGVLGVKTVLVGTELESLGYLISLTPIIIILILLISIIIRWVFIAITLNKNRSIKKSMRKADDYWDNNNQFER